MPVIMAAFAAMIDRILEVFREAAQVELPNSIVERADHPLHAVVDPFCVSSRLDPRGAGDPDMVIFVFFGAADQGCLVQRQGVAQGHYPVQFGRREGAFPKGIRRGGRELLRRHWLTNRKSEPPENTAAGYLRPS